MAATSRVRSTVALLGVLALLGNMLAGAFPHSTAAHASVPSAQAPISATSPAIVDPVLGVLPICHSAADTPTADGQAPGGHPGGSGAGHCPACTLIAKYAVAIALAFQPVTFTVALLPSQPAAARTQTLADHLSLGGIRSRAPPLSA
jgi:hypothetical protein